MVTPAKRVALPHQSEREVLELQQAVEDKRRQDDAKGRERTVTYTRAADTLATDASNDTVHTADKRTRLESVAFVPNADVTANFGNHALFKLQMFDPLGGRTATIATASTQQKSVKRGQPIKFDVTVRNIPATFNLALQVLKVLSGVALPEGQLRIELTEGLK